MKLIQNSFGVGLALTLLSAGDEQERLSYTVSFWTIPCVDVEMVKTDVDQTQISLEFSAKTRSFFDYFFAVDNHYNTWYNAETFHMMKYETKIDQPNVEQTLEVNWDAENSSYSSSATIYSRPEGTHNLFSLLMRARSEPWNEIDTVWWPVEHEGKPYRGRYLWIDSTEVSVESEDILADHYRLDLERTDGESKDLAEATDVFSWGIVLDGCIRQIWVERNGDRRILRAEVSVRGFILKAKLNGD